MAQNKNEKVQGNLNFAIVDEVDNILIDEARTPLIISGPAPDKTQDYKIRTKKRKGIKEWDEIPILVNFI